ncbi:MAG: hypothetical protein KDD62_11880, partial [Bdellovibrionales bacterium]|nr:hypothetical protein [Bdellovibrionales bacterium]
DSLSPYLVTIHAGKTYLYSLKRKEFVPRTSVLLWGSSKDPIANVEGLRITNWTFTSIPLRAHLPKLKQQADSWVAAVLKWYSVNRLSLSTQHSFSVLLLLPLAALMIAFLRNVVGIRTFGTFMPAILSLAFRETGLLAGLLLFIVVVIFGVLLRMSFKYFRLLLVPRLCATLTCVVMLLFGLSIFGANFRIHSLSSLSLFPVVILAMVIERLSIAIDEYGYRKALSTLGLSLVAAALAYLLISYHFVSYLFSAFPELNLSVLGLAILLGRYFGYRLTELVRFKSFADKELS